MHIKKGNSLRRWLASSATVLGLVAAAPALAVDNLKIMVPANPGGGWDQTGRGLAAAAQKHDIIKQFQIDNKGGAGGTIGLAQFINSQKGDPNALIVGGSVMVGGILINKSPVSLKQVTPVARLTGEYDVLVVPANSPIKSLKELMDKFKADPGSVSWGGGSAGGTDHIIVGMIAQDQGVDVKKINYIPFAGGGEAVASVVGGHVTAGLSGYSEFAGQIESGKLRPLGVTSAQRLKGIDVPTLKEQGVDVELANWRAVFGAPGLSEAQTRELVKMVDQTVRSKTWQDLLEKNGWADAYLPGDAFKTYLESDISRTEKILTGLGLIK
jgi:putative tricarboxylic transport membrane protein